jgi:hypothetical protein
VLGVFAFGGDARRKGGIVLTKREKVATVIGRMIAVFLATGLSVIAAGTIAGVELWQSFLMAGIGGVATVVEGLSRAYLKDGNLSLDEINEVFSKSKK